MLIIKAVYVGDSSIAFIENRFKPGINVVFSTDNHVGKTIVMQSLMFALGSKDGFPPSFPGQKYFYIVDFDIDGVSYSVLRQKDAFSVLSNDGLRYLEGEGEFRKFWNEEIGELPHIIKNDNDHMVYLSLFNQLFFVPQSDRSSSSLLNHGFYKKDEFFSMIASIKGLVNYHTDQRKIAELKERRETLKVEQKRLFKQIREFNAEDPALAVISSAVDGQQFQNTMQAIDDLQKTIGDLQRNRNKEYARKKQLEELLTELRSMNRTFDAGSLVCLKCGSDQVGFRAAKSRMTFDVTTPEMRKSIEFSVYEKSQACQSEIRQISEDIIKAQSELNDLLNGRKFSLHDVTVYQDDVVDLNELDDKYKKLESELDEIKEELLVFETTDKELREKRNLLRDQIVSSMNAVYRYFDEDDLNPYEDIMTKNGKPFKGSEETEYFLARCYALALTLHHKYPIVIDSFRAEDLATHREDGILEAYKLLPNQVIFTTTIKEEEFGKYSKDEDINPIDYSSFKTKHLLQEKYALDMKAKLAEFGVVEVEI